MFAVVVLVCCRAGQNWQSGKKCLWLWKEERKTMIRKVTLASRKTFLLLVLGIASTTKWIDLICRASHMYIIPPPPPQPDNIVRQGKWSVTCALNSTKESISSRVVDSRYYEKQQNRIIQIQILICWWWWWWKQLQLQLQFGGTTVIAFGFHFITISREFSIPKKSRIIKTEVENLLAWQDNEYMQMGEIRGIGL